MRYVSLPFDAEAYCLSRSSATRLPGWSERKKAMTSTGVLSPWSTLTVWEARLCRLFSVRSQRAL